MAVTGLLALLDDMSMLMDDVATMTKVAAKKTAGLAGDDLAVNAEGLVGLAPSRELPIVGKVALGSAVNKCVLIPLALLLPQSFITPLLMLGGAFLCYEGVHKVLHRKDKHDEEHHDELLDALQAPDPKALQQVESRKIRQAITTDVILSAEIVAVTLGAVADQEFRTKATVLTIVAFGMTIAIYGLVAGIVKLDDIGLHLRTTGSAGSLKQRFGALLVDKTPLFMKGLSVVGTIAMFLVGGGIILHGIPGAEARLEHWLGGLGGTMMLKSALGVLAPLVVGVGVGAVVLALVTLVKKVMSRVRAASPSP